MATYEIYRNKANQKVFVETPSDDLDYEATMRSEEHGPVDVDVSPAPGGVEVTIPFKFTQLDGKVIVKLSFTTEGESYSVEHVINVFTPLFTPDDVSAADLKALGISEEDKVYRLRDLERFIRHIIEAYTGQTFGYLLKSFEVPRSGTRVLFNVPILEFIGVSDRYATHSTTLVSGIPYEVIDDGFGLVVDWDRYNIKTDSFLPFNKPTPVCLNVRGKFGYLSVPEDVKQAALTLLGLFMCDQSLWRDRYIENLRNADGSTLKYNEGAYFGTGSVSADQLLEKYVRTGTISVDVV